MVHDYIAILICSASVISQIRFRYLSKVKTGYYGNNYTTWYKQPMIHNLVVILVCNIYGSFVDFREPTYIVIGLTYLYIFANACFGFGMCDVWRCSFFDRMRDVHERHAK